MTQQTFWWKSARKSCRRRRFVPLAESFAANFTAELDNAGTEHGDVSWFAAPRRLALKVANLSAAQADREIEKRGPAIARRSTPKANRAKRPKAGRAAAASPSIRRNAW